MNLRNKYSDKFSGLVSFGENNNKFMDKVCAILLAISPILQHYKGIFTEAGILVLIIMFPYLLLKLLGKLYDGKITFILPIAPLLFYFIFRVLNHGTSITGLLQASAMIFYFMIVSSGCINLKYFFKAAVIISLITSGLLVVQYFFFYLLGFHIHLNPTNLLLEESSRWLNRSQTGSGGALYRPSAIFLEPSHIFIYTFPIITILLLTPKMTTWRLSIALIITLGLLLSTSGMGIGFAIGIWFLYLTLYRSDDNVAKVKNLLSLRTMLIIVLIPIVLVILYYSVDFFKMSMDRIFAPANGRSAIQGRISASMAFVRSLKENEYWFGSSVSLTSIDKHMSGFFGTLFRHGWIGVVLGYIFYLNSLFMLKAQYFWVSFMIIVISFFTAHSHGTFYMLYFVTILMDGYNMKNTNRLIGFKTLFRKPVKLLNHKKLDQYLESK